MQIILHVTTEKLWEAAKAANAYTCPSLENEKFIHCCNASQLAGVLQRYYQGQTGLLQLQIDPDKLQSELKYEVSPSIGEAFAHIYGPINLDAIIAVTPIENN
jgi:uncharacterized protein (DUF952 family)